MEAAAVCEVFASYRSPDDPRNLRAVKANIGCFLGRRLDVIDQNHPALDDRLI